jgi:hypothetical protein
MGRRLAGLTQIKRKNLRPILEEAKMNWGFFLLVLIAVWALVGCQGTAGNDETAEVAAPA